MTDSRQLFAHTPTAASIEPTVSVTIKRPFAIHRRDVFGFGVHVCVRLRINDYMFDCLPKDDTHLRSTLNKARCVCVWEGGGCTHNYHIRPGSLNN